MSVTNNCSPATCTKSRPVSLETKGSQGKALVKRQEIGKSRTPLKRYKQQLASLSTIERQVAVGIMLGDASLQTQDGGKSYRLKLLQGDKNKDYLFHLSAVFSRWVLSPPSPQNRQSKTTGGELKAWRSQTISHKAFNTLAKIFLDDKGKKRIPTNLVKRYLTDRGLAYWLMDDGGKSNYNKGRPKLRGVTINTQGFLRTEVDHLVAQLASVFNLDCWVGKNKGRWTIVISGKSFPILAKKIAPYIHHSMVSKFPKELQEFL
ncbi:MAG: hypothetical protein M1812_008109 [Candelaria pacifica]|nr:MAG: hypothetical protein M1812_008109 [Candelaria pacifica]